MKLIEVKNLNKQFGDKKAINNLSFSIEKGKIFGFLGPSGSGKTTTINILTGQLSSDSGQSIILGTDSSQLGDIFTGIGLGLALLSFAGITC